jgi:epoxyqueuosine reductase
MAITMSFSGDHPEDFVLQAIQRFVSEHPENGRSRLNGVPYFENPLVGIAAANDPLFLTFKAIIGDFHLTPVEVLEKSFPEHQGSWEGASVISWVLPIARSTRERNRCETRCSSDVWLLTKTCGEAFNIKLAECLASLITGQGFCAVVPTLTSFFEIIQSEQHGFAANWSERHVAFAAGLGTFGLSGALITQRGVAMRCGSLVTDLPLKPSPRLYSSAREYCLFTARGTCGKCIERCPGGAISPEGHDKELCMIQSVSAVQEIAGDSMGMPGCGLCQTAVPCEACIPKKD